MTTAYNFARYVRRNLERPIMPEGGTVYSTTNYRTKKELKASVKVGSVTCYQPGPFGPDVPDGEYCCEGPHYPEPHRWYARVKVVGGRIVKVLA